MSEMADLIKGRKGVKSARHYGRELYFDNCSGRRWTQDARDTE